MYKRQALYFPILVLQKNQDVPMEIVIMVLEHGLTLIKQPMLVIGLMGQKKAKVLKHGQMDMFMKVNLMTVNGMVLES